MPARKARGSKSSPSTRGAVITPDGVADTPRPEHSTPAKAKSRASKVQGSPTSASKGIRRRKLAVQVDNDSDDEISVMLGSQGGAKSNAFKPRQKVSLRRLWDHCSGAALIAIVIVLFIILLKIGEDEYLDVTSSSTRAASDPYHTLGVKTTATKKQIRKAYRALTLKWHPDRQEHGCDDQCRLKFNEIHQAYRLLMDDERRSLYDAYQYDSMPDTKKAFVNKIESWEFSGSVETVKSILKPSLNGGQLSLPPHVTGAWAYLVADTRHEVTDYILETWTEIASKLYGKVAFMRIEGSDHETRKHLPLNPVMLPAIVYCDPINRCQIYNQLMNYGPVTFPKWLLAQYPKTVIEWTQSLDDLANLMTAGISASGKTPIIITGGLKPPSIIKALALKTGEAFEWIYTDSVEIVEKLDIQYFEMDKGTRGLIFSPNVNKAIIQLHGGLWQLDKERWYRERSESDDVRTARHGYAYLTLIESLTNVSRSNEMLLTEETLLYLCHSRNPQQRIICRVRVDPTEPLVPDAIEKVKNMPLTVELSHQEAPDDDEIAGLIDEETELDLESEDADDLSEDGAEENSRNETLQIVLQPVRMYTTRLGSLRSSLVKVAQSMSNNEFLLDFAAGKYRSIHNDTWIGLPKRCLRQESSASIVGASCAPRANLSPKDRLRLFLLDPVGFARAIYLHSTYQLLWVAPTLACYAIASIYVGVFVGSAALRKLMPDRESPKDNSQSEESDTE